jgi:hypothetical protein
MDEPTTPAAPERRRRGARPGNQNARKHGYYSRNFRTPEYSDLELFFKEGISDEIIALRIFAGRMLEIANNTDMSLEQAIANTNAFGTAAVKLSHLLREQKEFGGDNPQQVLVQAIENIRKELAKKHG